MPADPVSSSPSAPTRLRLPRYIKRQNRARPGGVACLEQHGLDHYRRMSALGREAKKAKPRQAKTSNRAQYTFADGQIDTVRAIAYHAGVSQSSIVREALAEYIAKRTAEADLDPGSAGAKAPKRKQPKLRKP